jgi:hypothetical protein
LVALNALAALIRRGEMVNLMTAMAERGRRYGSTVLIVEDEIQGGKKVRYGSLF